MVRFTFLLAFLVLSRSLSAQNLCSTDFLHQTSLSSALYRAQYDKTNSLIRNAIAQQNQARTMDVNTVYTIPVVVHVMHKGEALGSGVNLSNAQIQSALKQLNERFRKVTGSIGDGTSVDMKIQFALAVRDPDGNCTDGINRIDMTDYPDYMAYGVDYAPGMDELVMKALSFWDSHYYANVWIVSYAFGTGGFAHYAGEHGSVKDGVVMTPAAINTPTFTHEFGHYLNLIHTFGDSNGSCSFESDCAAEGDMVCDTPPQEVGAPCALTPNACVPGQDIAVVNYMSYSCQTEFTEGQKERARTALSTVRASLLEENGNMALIPTLLSTPEFAMNRLGNCLGVGDEVRFLDETPCMPNTLIASHAVSGISYEWKMTNNNNITLISAEQNPSFVIPTAGTYDVTLKITTSMGSSSTTEQNFVSTETGLPLAASCATFTSIPIDITRVDDIGIREVLLNDLHHVSGTVIQDAIDGVTDINGYADFSCGLVATLEPFTEYTMQVRLSEYYDELIHVFIDFDNNGFTQEDLVTSASVPLGSGYFDLPAFTTPGFPLFNTKFRMRVIVVDSGEPSPAPCGDIGTYGQTQDYSVMFNNLIPLAVNDAETIYEDHTSTINVKSNDSDPDGALFSGTVDLDPSTPLFQNTATTPEGAWSVSNDQVKFVPNANYYGVATIKYVVSDNRFAASLPATISVTVNAVNDVPSFVSGANQQVEENSGVQVDNGWATAISAGPANESAQLLEFIVTNDRNALFAIQPSINPNGTLTYTPAMGAFGVANVSVTLMDSGGTNDGGINSSPTQTFTITITHVEVVTAVEDAPSEIQIYPNPSGGLFTVIMPDFNNATNVRVRDLLGRIVFEQTNAGSELSFELTGKGMYVVEIDGWIKKVLVR